MTVRVLGVLIAVISGVVAAVAIGQTTASASGHWSYEQSALYQWSGTAYGADYEYDMRETVGYKNWGFLTMDLDSIEIYIDNTGDLSIRDHWWYIDYNGGWDYHDEDGESSRVPAGYVGWIKWIGLQNIIHLKTVTTAVRTGPLFNVTSRWNIEWPEGQNSASTPWHN